MLRTVFLTGFMGSGKSTLGKKLAAQLGFRFIDLDRAICTSYQFADVKTLVGQKGIGFFRDAESTTLKTLDCNNAIIATGGGTPCYFNNMDWMKVRGTVVYLQLDEKSIFNRLKQTSLDERPLLKGMDDEALQKFIWEKLAERLHFYTQAHITFNPINGKIEELAEMLVAFND